MSPLVLPILPLLAALGGDIVLILDNSGSMVHPVRTLGGTVYPANDPERAAVLGALVVEGLARGTRDRVAVIGFGDDSHSRPRVVGDAEAIRALPYSGGTWFRAPLIEARKRLEASAAEKRMLFLFTDGAPSDIERADEAPALLGLDQGAPFEVIAIGLYGSREARRQGEIFLGPLVRSPDDLIVLDHPSQVLREFTAAYARALGSRSNTGTLAPGASHAFEVGKYVTEVLVMTASSEPGPPFNSVLHGPAGEVPVQAEGDNGCPAAIAPAGLASACAPPRRHYRVFRSANDPRHASRWTLSLPHAPGAVEYGVILRYDLEARLELPATAQVGLAVPIEARLLSRGQTFDDEDFFRKDGFAASVRIGDEEVPLQHAGGGVFRGSWTPLESTEQPLEARLVFRTTWMQKDARRSIHPVGALDLRLLADPPVLDLGTWKGERGRTQRCGTVDLRRSRHAESVPLRCSAEGALTEGSLFCNPVPGSEGPLPNGAPGQPLAWEVCLVAPPCCGEVQTKEVRLVFRGASPPYDGHSLQVPLQARVEAAGWLACWWPWLTGGGMSLFSLWFLLGWIRPHGFDPTASLRLAGSEEGLRRSAALNLGDLPGGRRGFYRNARLCVNGAGDFLRSPRRALLFLEAGVGGSSRFRHAPGMEKKTRRGQWEPVSADDLAAGPGPNTVYRIGNLYVKFD